MTAGRDVLTTGLTVGIARGAGSTVSLIRTALSPLGASTFFGSSFAGASGIFLGASLVAGAGAVAGAAAGAAAGALPQLSHAGAGAAQVSQALLCLKRPRKRPKRSPPPKLWPWPQAGVASQGAGQGVGHGAGAGAARGASHAASFLHEPHENRPDRDRPRSLWPNECPTVGPHESQAATAGAGALQLMHGAGAG